MGLDVERKGDAHSGAGRGTVTERRAGGELRAEGRRLSGTVMRYGDVSPSHRERFEPGALRMAEAVPLNLFHDPERAVAWMPGGGLELRQSRDAVTLRAELPPIPAADRALALVRGGDATGLSVEFHAVRERREGGLRVIEEARLSGVGIVRAPSYGAARVEARAKSGRTLRSSIPVDRELACECIAQAGPGSGAACIPIVKLQTAVSRVMAETIQRAAEGAGADVLAVYKDYARPLGSARRGTLRAVEAEDGLHVEVDLPTGEAGDMAVSASEAAGLIARPLVDFERSEYQDTPEGRIVTRPHLRAILIGATDARAGWPEARIDYDGAEQASADAPRRRERRLWL